MDDENVNGKPNTARSYRTAIVDDNFSVQLNIKWLGQILLLAGMLVYGYWNIIARIETLENGMATSDSKIGELVSKHIEDEEVRYAKMEQGYAQMEEELKWYQKSIDMNPLSILKKRKK